MKIPKATPDQKRVGWTINFDFLDKITNKTNAKSENGICVEHTEEIVLQLVKLGYLQLED